MPLHLVRINSLHLQLDVEMRCDPKSLVRSINFNQSVNSPWSSLLDVKSGSVL